ncbi:MAG: ATP-binding protein [Defluviitaleaceae bacterium]|nr:ATP-binding protein [Defluviitaleaceae bacterium]
MFTSYDGEGLTIEFKRCTGELTNSVFETVSAFSNRYGGYILLCVEDNGSISGVNPSAVQGLKKNFVNTLNNPQRFARRFFANQGGSDDAHPEGALRGVDSRRRVAETSTFETRRCVANEEYL